MIKTYLIDVQPREGDQVFSYYHRGEAMLHFNTTLLSRVHKEIPEMFRRITMDIDENIYRLTVEHRGIEEPKVSRLVPRQLRQPGYGVIFEDDSFTIVDGHHRLVRRYRGGVRVMDFYVTVPTIWRQCLVPYSAEHEAIIARDIPERVHGDGAYIATGATLHPNKDK